MCMEVYEHRVLFRHKEPRAGGSKHTEEKPKVNKLYNSFQNNSLVALIPSPPSD
jgi:hypothetical protein